MDSERPRVLDELESLWSIPESVVIVLCSEQQTVLESLPSLARRVLGESARLVTWGLDSREPLEAVLDKLSRATDPMLAVFRDAAPFSEPAQARKLSTLSEALAERPVRVLVLASEAAPPAPLADDLPILTWPPASPGELVELVNRELGRAGLDGQHAPEVALSLLGLGPRRARAALRRVLALSGSTTPRLLELLFGEKLARTDGAGVLEYHPSPTSLDELGGLAFFKHWATRRAGQLEAAAAAGARGLLLVGVPGCGKSQAAKSLGQAWSLPVYRLDMSRVFSGSAPGPEAAFTRGLEAVSRLAPALLWIDELETAFSAGALDTGTASRVYASFLTWLQERPPDVLVAATANRIQLLPPELLRKGRFDQLFFVDLPDREERKQITRIHLVRQGHEAGRFDLIVLARATASWSGAEIEALIREATLDAAIEGAELDQARLLQIASQAVPLATTMEEPIRKLREWAHRRTLHASTGTFK